jgi:thioredoxin 1
MSATFTDSNFQAEVLESEVPVFVDFWGPWCGPCHRLAPVIDKLAEGDRGFKVGKVNIDENQATTAKYNIRAVPTVVLFHRGQEFQRFVGLKKESDYLAAVEVLLKPKSE